MFQLLLGIRQWRWWARTSSKTTKWFSAFESLFRMSFGANKQWRVINEAYQASQWEQVTKFPFAPSSHIELGILGSASFIAQHTFGQRDWDWNHGDLAVMAPINLAVPDEKWIRWKCNDNDDDANNWEFDWILTVNQNRNAFKTFAVEYMCRSGGVRVATCHSDFTHYFPFHEQSSAALRCPFSMTHRRRYCFHFFFCRFNLRWTIASLIQITWQLNVTAAVWRKTMETHSDPNYIFANYVERRDVWNVNAFRIKCIASAKIGYFQFENRIL